MAFPLTGDDTVRHTLPSPIPNPYWVAFSPSCAKLIGVPVGANQLPTDKQWLDLLAGNSLKTNTHQFPHPIASVYSGHQFGVWAGQLGDGRAILLGDIAGQELQLKGAGKTAYSRMGDGRAVLRSSIREFLCSEAMHALGIPTSRALAVVGSKMPVLREVSETAAICARVAPSFMRVGHFEHFSSLQNTGRLKELADDLITHHYPHCLDSAEPYLALFNSISKRNAALVAQWQAVGFCHGVLNSDNISVLGLTIDYGPFGFLDQFQIDHICNHSDHSGRYAYHRQPQIMHWNMACLASAMLPLLELNHSREDAQALLTNALEDFPSAYAQVWQKSFRDKLGLYTSEEADIRLIERLLQLMHDSRADYTSLFRNLGSIEKGSRPEENLLRDQFLDRSGFDLWLKEYFARLAKEPLDDQTRKMRMNAVNPKYVLRNHLAQHAIELAQNDDFSEVHKLLNILSMPFDDQPQHQSYSLAPPEDLQTISVSCSS